MSQSTYIFCKEDLQYVQPAVCVPQVVAIVESGSLHVEKFFFTLAIMHQHPSMFSRKSVHALHALFVPG